MKLDAVEMVIFSLLNLYIFCFDLSVKFSLVCREIYLYQLLGLFRKARIWVKHISLNS